MLEKGTSVLKSFKLILDLILVACAVFVVLAVDAWLRGGYYPSNYIKVLVVLMFIWVTLLHYFGMYGYFRIKKAPNVLRAIFKTTLFGFIIYMRMSEGTQKHGSDLC